MPGLHSPSSLPLREQKGEGRGEERRVDDGVYYYERAGYGREGEGDGEMPAPDSLIAAAQLCVPL